MQQQIARQLTYGEQLGGVDISNFAVGPYLRDAARLRDQIKRYFYAGEMGRPLSFPDVQTVTSNWSFLGWDNWVTTKALANGVWLLPNEGKAVCIFVNPTDAAISTTVNFDPSEYSIFNGSASVNVLTPDGISDSFPATLPLSRSLAVPAHTSMAWELYSDGNTRAKTNHGLRDLSQFNIRAIPFSHKTCIGYTLSEQQTVQLCLYSPDGREIVHGIQKDQPAGNHEFILETAKMSSGVYIIKLKTLHGMNVKKMIQ
jgi:hypothetical protein